MKLKNLLFGVIVLTLSCVALSLPARAGAITLEASGTLGPLMSGIDPLKLNGGSFTVTGTLDQNSAATSVTADIQPLDHGPRPSSLSLWSGCRPTDTVPRATERGERMS